VDASTRLQRLRDRRLGLVLKDGRPASQITAFAALSRREAFESLAEPPNVKYALGSMQPVGADYTKKSYEEGNRVRDRLIEGFQHVTRVAFDYQGSVPLDVHIRGNSDVDLLLLNNEFVTHDATAPQYKAYGPYYGKAPVDELLHLRSEAAAILTRRYYAAQVDTTGAKSIRLSGGSLERDIDVVPSHWHDTTDYVRTGDKTAREVFIYDAKNHQSLNNRPFLHIKHVAEKCDQHRGSLRKVIRLLKNLRADASPEIELSSYDIAAIAWHMSTQALTVPFGVELLLVDRAKQHLALIITQESYRNLLCVPDGSRKIFDNASKLTATLRLYHHLDCLANDIYRELDPMGRYSTTQNASKLLERYVAL
jgi:hypothetical protein